VKDRNVWECEVTGESAQVLVMKVSFFILFFQLWQDQEWRKITWLKCIKKDY